MTSDRVRMLRLLVQTDRKAPRITHARQKQQKRPGRIRTDLLSLVICRQDIRGKRASGGAATPLGEENAGRRVWFQILIE